ncbi:hypothetical protein D3C79_1073670 [compost metagenome]
MRDERLQWFLASLLPQRKAQDFDEDDDEAVSSLLHIALINLLTVVVMLSFNNTPYFK